MQAFEKADTDGSGQLDQDEFVSAFMSVPQWGIQTEEQLMHLFMKIDANSDGTVDWDEFTNHMMLEQARQIATEEGQVDNGEVWPPTLREGSRAWLVQWKNSLGQSSVHNCGVLRLELPTVLPMVLLCSSLRV